MSGRFERYRAPEGFIPVRSHVDGIEVYAPAAVEEVLEHRTRCPSCGAGIAWAPGRQALHCRHCGYESEAQSGIDAGEGEFTAEALQRGQQGWGGDARPEMSCDSCGAILTLDPDHLATHCPFCASSHVVVHATARGQSLRPGRVLPFTVEQGAAAASAKEWLGSGWLRPPGTVEAARLDAFMGMYLPFWVFGAKMICAYEVEVGHDRWVTETRDGRTTRRRVTDWSWRSGEVVRVANDVVVRGTTRVAGLERVGAYPVESLVPYTPDVLVGFAAHGYDVPLPEAWDRGRAVLRERAAAAAKGDAGGDRQRNFSAAVDLDDEHWHYALFPVWVSAYRTEGYDAPFVVLVNGVTGTVGGTRPVAWMRVYLATAALLLPGFFTGVCIGLPTLLFMGFGLLVWVFAFFLLIVGGVLSVLLWQKAVREESL
jgi:predicted RNA-binding Zn-ribbon protein involved in translation (DUF1610 family)